MTLFHLSSIRQPLSQEELTWWFQLPQSLIATGRFSTVYGPGWSDHPPLYALLLAATFAVFGIGEIQARLLGLVLGLVTLVVFYRTARLLEARYAPGRPFASLALCLYALHPLVLQSTLLVEADTTLGSFLAALLALCAARSPGLSTRRDAALVGLLLGLLLWVKIYVAILAVVALAGVTALNDGWRRAVGRTGRIAVVALAFFALTWVPTARILAMDPLRPFVYAADAVRRRSLGEPLARMLSWPKELVEVSLWVSPGLVLAAPLVAAAWLLRRRRRPESSDVQFLASWGALQLIVTLLFVGPLYGFPKYQAPCLPLLLLVVPLSLVAATGAGARSLWSWVGAGVASGAIVYPFAGDLLLRLRVDLKMIALREPERIWIAGVGLALAAAAYLVLPPLLLLAWPDRPRRWPDFGVAALLAAHVSLMTGLVVAQTSAGYATRYAYGDQGVRGVAEVVQREAAPGRVIAPLQVAHYARVPLYSPLIAFWDRGADTILPAILDPGVCCLVYSLAHNSLAQLRYLDRDPALAAALRDHGFVKRTIGTFTVWYRPATGSRG